MGFELRASTGTAEWRRCPRAAPRSRRRTRSPPKVAEVGARCEHFPRRDRAARIGRREIDPDVPGRVGLNRQVAVFDREHAVDFAERRFAAGVRRLDDIGRGALRDPQRLHREARMQRPVHAEDERHSAHDPVGVRPPIDEADAGCVLRQLGQGSQSPRRGGQEFRRVVAGGDETCLGGAAGPNGRVGDEATKDDRRAVDRAREHIVRGLAGRRVGVGAILSENRKSNTIAAAPGVLQRLHQRREAVSRPRPLPELLEQFVVDIDDADGLVERIGTRLPALVLVEDQVLNHGARRRADDSSHQRECAGCGRGQCVESGLACFSHSVLAVPRTIKNEESPVLSSRWRPAAAPGRPIRRDHSPSNAPIVRRRILLGPRFHLAAEELNAPHGG